jgi:hypothetical protein
MDVQANIVLPNNYYGLWRQQNMQVVGRLLKTLAWIGNVFIQHYSNASSLMMVC